ncbi:hypothetical protein SEMRO_2953_G340950.1 [Seminavis robusta]|nr:hypothetical protein SEMRO_2953_G340950.1 [Seminavis robusta]|eukprot:Sro2953_g340950.1 n/a (198) ;mRNA; f:8772-9767
MSTEERVGKKQASSIVVTRPKTSTGEVKHLKATYTKDTIIIENPSKDAGFLNGASGPDGWLAKLELIEGRFEAVKLGNDVPPKPLPPPKIDYFKQLLESGEAALHMARLNTARHHLELEFQSRMETGEKTDGIEEMLADLERFVQDNADELDKILARDGEPTGGDNDMDVEKPNNKRGLENKEDKDGTENMDGLEDF